MFAITVFTFIIGCTRICVYNSCVHEFALWPISKQTKQFLLFLQISFRADGFAIFQYLRDLWLDKPQKTHALLSLLWFELRPWLSKAELVNTSLSKVCLRFSGNVAPTDEGLSFASSSLFKKFNLSSKLQILLWNLQAILFLRSLKSSFFNNGTSKDPQEFVSTFNDFRFLTRDSTW